MSKKYFYDDEGDLDLNSIFRLIWESKLSIVIVGTVAILLSYVFVKQLDSVYTASTKLIPVSAPKAEGVGGALIDMIGVNVGGGGVNNAQLAAGIFSTRDFFKYLIKDENLLIDLVSVNSFEGKEDNYDPNIYDIRNKSWVTKPTFEESYAKYIDGLRVSYAWELGGFISISFTHISPNVAAQTLDTAIKEMNQIQRSKDIQFSEESINFLQEESRYITNTDLKIAVSALMQNHLKTKMFANTKEFYIVEPLDSIYPPIKTSGPNKLLYLMIITSLIMSLYLILLVILKIRADD